VKLIVVSFGDCQAKRLELVLISTGNYEVWLTTQLLQPEVEDCEFSSQVLFESDTLSQAATQPVQFDS